MMAKRGNDDPLLSELVSIKRLLAFALLRMGASQGEVASALGVDQSAVSRMFSTATKKGKGGGKSKTKE
jgi:predicted transcriptional regulator